jgi:hypothetical protein
LVSNKQFPTYVLKKKKNTQIGLGFKITKIHPDAEVELEKQAYSRRDLCPMAPKWFGKNSELGGRDCQKVIIPFPHKYI